MNNERAKETPRGDVHVEKYTTGIFEEVAAPDNPYGTGHVYCYGYDQLALNKHLDFASYLYLLMRGSLPDVAQAGLLNRALIAFANPGVRHPATRAAATAAVGKTLHSGVLPVAMMLMCSEQDGADSVARAMRCLRKSVRSEPGAAITSGGDEFVFGLCAGSENSWLDKVCDTLIDGGDYPYLNWGRQHISATRASGKEAGWLQTGLVAATFADLGILPRLAPGLLQLLAAPGLLAQGMEHANRDTAVMPFLSDEQCEIDRFDLQASEVES
ncbi:MAG: hypothetical protein KJP25_10115 [Gammaproteobacteria bacterium]|nr:hypothetical protein [Gammaproteobacteria bacterium]NND39712.1 hypothetical protein [Pseudomonadales bacterium]NNM12611.1 hypothetical protein [Pseudomonadales bacterium]